MPRAAFTEFIGPANRQASLRADAEDTYNWFIASPAPGKGTPSLLPSPGLETFALLPDGPVRALYSQDGRCFAVGNISFCEILPSQTVLFRGFVPASNDPATIASNGPKGGHQLLVESGGGAIIFDLNTNTVTAIADPDFLVPCKAAVFLDGFFISLLALSNTFQFSDLLDGSVWSGLDVDQVSTSTDNIRNILAVHRELYLFGSQTSQVWVDAGDPSNPLQPLPGSQMENGILADWSAVVCDNAPFILGTNKDGGGIVYRVEGTNMRRVSTDAVEYDLSLWPRLDNAIAYTFTMRGHTFYHLYLPNADWSWRYDVGMNLWHKVADWDPAAEQWKPHRSRCHTFAFDKHHLVGDPLSSAVYRMAPDLFTDSVQGL